MKSVHRKTEIELLTHEIKKLNTNFRWRNSLFHGIVAGFGSAIGAGLLVALVALLLGKLTGLPLLGQLFQFLAGHLTNLK